MQKTIKTRIQNKHDIQANWERAINFIPLAGELIVYDADYDAVSNPNGYKYPRFKIGDGIVNSETQAVEGTNVNDLPFYAGSWNDLIDKPNDLATESYVNSVLPTKLSELDNDPGFITKVPDEYITESELTAKGYLTEHQDISHLAEKSELFSGSYNDLSDKPSIPSIAGLASESYVDNKVSTHNTKADAHSDIRILITELTTRLNAIVEGTDEDLDQLKEIVAYIKNNKSLIDGITTNKVNVSDIINNLTTNVANKPLSAAQGVALKALIDTLQGEFDLHGHEISEISGLQDALDGKAGTSHGTHVTFSTTAPVVDGTASAGSATTVARSDHKHPTDTTRAAQADFAAHIDTHAPSNAEKNQNAFSNITVGSTTIAADTATDTVTLVAGSNVTITPDATNDKITIAATDTVYTHPSYTAKTSGLYKITVDSTGHVNGATVVEKADITALGIPAQDTDTHYKAVPHAGSNASTSATATTNGNTYINIVENGARSGGINIKGAGATTVTSDANGVITISSTDNNTTYNTATATTSGLTKLYASTGSATDGSMTQNAITTALNGKEASGAAATALTNAKSYTDEKIASIISCGTADPSSSITSQFYFKYTNS